jgi:SAM-dependent methyltransferase
VKELYFGFLKWAKLTNGVGRTALDIGTGFGYVVDLLTHLGYNAIGLDISNFACQKNVFDVVQADGSMLPFNEKTFDLITVFETIEHFNNSERALHDIARCLTSNGHVLLTTPTRFGSTISGQNKYHPSVKSWCEWITLLNETGFSKYGHESYGITPRIFGKYRVMMHPWPIPATHMVVQAWC